MGIFNRGKSDVMNVTEVRNLLGDDSIFYPNSTSGAMVTPSKAIEYAAIYACIKVISETIGQLSIDIFKKTKDGRETDTNNSLTYILHNKPNKLMTSSVFHRTMIIKVLLNGNAYAKIIRDKFMNVIELQIITKQVTVELNESTQDLFYTIENEKRKYKSFEILHFKGMTTNGYLGISPIETLKNTIGLGISEQEFATRFFSNGATVAAILTKDGSLTAEQSEKMSLNWKKAFSKVSNSNKTAVLDGTWKYQQIGVDPEKGQLLNSRKFSVVEISRIYRVPLHMIGDLDRSTNNNIEFQGTEFAKYTIMPYVKDIEQEYEDKLFKESEKKDGVIRFNIESLMRGDISARSDYYVKMINNGVVSPNEVRQLEGMNKREGGDIYLTQLNMTTDPNQSNNSKI